MTIDPVQHHSIEGHLPTMHVGRYQLITPLGRGAMATVHLARSVGSAGFERLAAVKALHRDLCSDRDLVDRFLDEARLAARLHHPNAAAILDVGVDGWQPYMVMDYVEGDTLHAVQCSAVSRREALPLGVVLRVLLDALAGLDAAHELRSAEGEPLGLIHRDVSPHNVLVGVDGVARLMDFGIARAATRRRATANGIVQGNVQFMAPEQLRGRALDRRADVFSMGVTLWETLALRRCFPLREGASMARFAREDYRPLGEHAPGVPAALDAICRRALAVEPDDRYATAADFASAIEEAFGRDVATQRELGQFMSTVASEKVEREREAARASARPLPVRAEAALVRKTTAADEVGRFRAVAAVVQTKLSTRRFGALPAPAGAGSLYDAVTQALFRRSHATRRAIAPTPEPATVKVRAMPSRPPSFAARPTLRPARTSVRPSPTGLDGPTRPMSALRRSRAPAALTMALPVPRQARWFGSLRALAARLWSRLAA